MHEPIVMNEAYPPTAINNPSHTSSLSNDSLGEFNTAPTPSDDDWEYVSSDSDNVETIEESKSDSQGGEFEEECSLIHRCESNPELLSFTSLGSIEGSDDDISYVLDCGSSSVDAQSISTINSDTILLSKKPSPLNPIKKVPSFKDMVASNALQLQEEERQKKIDQKALEDKRREEVLKRRKAIKTRLIVTPIKRCARSTGDLRSLVIHEEQEGYGGSSGGYCSAIIHEDDEVLGETDASEYYGRKSHGSKGHTNGRKIRPDEKKRKEMIIHKKNAQRKAQGVLGRKK